MQSPIWEADFACIPGAFRPSTTGKLLSKPVAENLRKKNVRIESLTLHTGRLDDNICLSGNSFPKNDDLYEEWRSISETTARRINEALESGKRVLAVGASVVRALESSVDEETGMLASSRGWTKLFIRPGHRFRITNMYLASLQKPDSAPYVLACSFAGNGEVKNLYRLAIESSLRFLDCGDSALYTD